LIEEESSEVVRPNSAKDANPRAKGSRLEAEALDLFQEILNLEPEERDRRLEELPAESHELRAEVEALLHLHEDVEQSTFLETPLAMEARQLMISGDPLLSLVDQNVGSYRVIDLLGQGGMAMVYLAEQREPIRRLVAIKIIKLGMDSRQVIARFEAERQALAMMDHPHVAKVLDAGKTSAGRPYFVMEYVKGIPITDYCERFHLTLRERLGLFTSVCQAIQHAHQKGIIHRDVKPSNVLVGVEDGQPLPRVIDFGVAKATVHRLTQETLFTEQGQLIGTPEYMSPEQVEMTGLNVDTRTDVYSLGVLLYELVSGVLPFDSEELRSLGFGEIRRLIREVDPPRPSLRLAERTENDAPAVDYPVTARELQGDVDAITMKAIEKDRTRRYGTASELADDLERHLQNEPVRATPPSVAYRVSKFARRNRVPVFVAAVFLFAGTAFGVMMSLLYEQVRRESSQIKAESLSTMRMYKSAFEAASDPMMTFDVDTGEMLEVNEAALRLWGYGREDFLALRVGDLSAEPDETAQQMRRIREGTKITVPRRRFRRADGTVFFGDAWGGRFSWEGRNIVMGVVRPVETDEGAEDETEP